MNNPRLAIRYAKSLIDLATEHDQLEEVNNDVRYLQKICASNPDFVVVLKSPIIKPDKKEKILHAIIEGRVGKLTSTFIKLLVQKGRELNLVEIIASFIEQYNQVRGIRRVKITTAVPMSKELETALIKQVAGSADINRIEVEAIVDESIIGGFLMETGGRLIDASISRDLKDVKKQFMDNEYIHKLR
ncbi:MAG: ATP synthase F1 subunit delta [Chitinophagaceae bacterium]